MIHILVIPAQELDAVIRLQNYQNQIQELQAKVADLEAENSNLRMFIQELQWRVDPFSSDGDATCNSEW